MIVYFARKKKIKAIQRESEVLKYLAWQKLLYPFHLLALCSIFPSKQMFDAQHNK